jgi:hypothetical protein
VHLRRLGTHALAAAGAIVAAASLAPAARAGSLEIQASARPSHGYAVSVLRGPRYELGGRPVDNVTGGVLLRRSAGHEVISRLLDLQQGGKVTATRSLSRGRARFDYGPRGHVTLRFRATGRLRRLGLDPCEVGRLRARRGIFTGQVRVHMGGTLGTVHRTRLRGRLIRNPAPADIDCLDFLPRGSFTRKLAFEENLPFMDFFDDGTLEVDGAFHNDRRWRTDDEIFAVEPGLLAVSPSNRHATAAVAGPFVSGELTWSALFPVVPDPRTGEFAVDGTVTGTLTARFDLLGDPRFDLTAPVDADLVGFCAQCG